MQAIVWAAMFVLIVSSTGCGAGWNNFSVEGQGRDGMPFMDPYDNILESSYMAADILVDALEESKLSPKKAMLAASLVNIDDLNESSTFGRLVSEQISSRLAQRGYPLIEMKLRQESVFIQKGRGEFLLSRELQDIGVTHDAAAVLVGTYAVTEGIVFVSIRMVRTKDNTVIAGHDYQLVYSDTVESLLGARPVS